MKAQIEEIQEILNKDLEEFKEQTNRDEKYNNWNEKINKEESIT